MEESLNFSNSFDSTSLCYQTEVMVGFTVFGVVYSLYVPVFLLVLHIGFKKWKKSSSGNFSHSDVFTFNVVLMEMCAIIGSISLISGLHIGLFSPQGKAGVSLIYMNCFGQCFFQCLTCVDRYLAVVFPVKYMKLRKGRGAFMRNISIAFVWLLCFGRIIFVLTIDVIDEPISSFILTITSVAIVTFCCVSVLCVLIRQKPGETAKDGKRFDQSKRRAFNTMAVILGALLLKFMSDTEYYILHFVRDLSINKCLLFLVVLWCGLPNSLVLPLLFLHRSGTLKACAHHVRKITPLTERNI